MTLHRCTTKTTLARTDSVVHEGAEVPAAERTPVKRNDETDLDRFMDRTPVNRNDETDLDRFMERTPVKRNDETDLDRFMEYVDMNKDFKPEPLAVENDDERKQLSPEVIEEKLCGTCRQRIAKYSCNP